MQLATYQLALTANKTELGTDIVNGLASDGESCGKHIYAAPMYAAHAVDRANTINNALIITMWSIAAVAHGYSFE